MADVTKGLYVRLEAKEGMVGTLVRFLESAQPLAEDEPGTTAWFAIRMGDSTFGSSTSFQTTRRARRT